MCSAGESGQCSGVWRVMSKRSEKSRRHRTRASSSRMRAAGTERSRRLGPSEYTLRRRADGLEECLHLYPTAIAMDLAHREEAGWHFGRLYLVGAIDRYQYYAAQRLARVVWRYRRMLSRYSHASASDPAGAIAKGVTEDLSEAAQRRFARARKDYDQVMGILDGCSDLVRGAVMAALERDEVADLSLLRQGLTALTVVS